MDHKVFVGGLHWFTNEQSLQQYFSEYGEIEEVRIIMDRVTGRSKGYGFVIFKDPASAQAAVTNPFPIIDGKQANCNLASLGAKTPTTPRPRKRYSTEWSYDATSPYGAGYGAYAQGMYGAQGYGEVDDTTAAAYGYENPAKRRRFEPIVSYLQVLQNEHGITVTKETATSKIEELRISDPTEAFKYFLEVSEVFKGTTEYDSYMTSLLEGAKAIRRQQMESDISKSNLGSSQNLSETHPEGENSDTTTNE
eukprot:TRINITY_DN1052_c0_g1_i2.p1 TRINITY_DN1052_c0_g1~~TRINITY_DN1052_c0_g1_i2.p1  ORF type:complete len:251 (+),score=55.26 TRINITY_DN1052_c0_g1_i2:88-840(+)